MTWDWNNDLVNLVKGRTEYSPSWWNAKHIITCCNLDDHWVTIRINLYEWTDELYDSLIFQSDGVYSARKLQLHSVLYLNPGLLLFSRYWQKAGREEIERPLKLVKMPIICQFMQFDGVGSGVFAAMYIDRLFCNKSPALNCIEKEMEAFCKVLGRGYISTVIWCSSELLFLVIK